MRLRRMPSARAVLPGLVAVALVSGLTACGSDSGAPSPGGAGTTPVPTNVAADATTRSIAEVEFVRQCEIATMSFPKESDIDADLATRLKKVGIEHLAWKNWHDALATSPQLVTQLAEVGAKGCPKA